MKKKSNFSKCKTKEKEEEEERELPPLSPNLNFEYESKIWQLTKETDLIENEYYNIKLNNLVVFVNCLYKDNSFFISKNKKIDRGDVEFCFLIEKK